jgi:hypothetical protein
MTEALRHEPMRPPRKGHDGEQVYASMWAAMMAEQWVDEWFNGDEPTPLECVLSDMNMKLEQRHATVVATVVCWLGCNMGMALVRRAQSEVSAGRWDEHHAYLLAWTLENRRVPYVNSGIRLVEYMLTPAEDCKPARSIIDTGIKKLPALSAEDLEVIDHVMLWLPTERGQLFIRQCEREIERLRDEERRRRHAEHLRLRERAGEAS